MSCCSEPEDSSASLRGVSGQRMNRLAATVKGQPRKALEALARPRRPAALLDSFAFHPGAWSKDLRPAALEAPRCLAYPGPLTALLPSPPDDTHPFTAHGQPGPLR